jgi:hypothetical protein
MRRFLEWLDKILNSPVMTLPWGNPDRRFLRELDERPILDDRAFYDTYYSGTGISEAIPAVVRKVYAERLDHRWNAVQPADRATDFDPELDLSDLLFAVGKAFGMCIPLDDMKAMDGSFDAVVRYIASRQTVAPGGPSDAVGGDDRDGRRMADG